MSHLVRILEHAARRRAHHARMLSSHHPRENDQPNGGSFGSAAPQHLMEEPSAGLLLMEGVAAREQSASPMEAPQQLRVASAEACASVQSTSSRQLAPSQHHAELLRSTM